MAGKILRRCTLCGGFHASYLVVNPSGQKSYLCYSCWKAQTAAQAASGQAPQGEGEPPSAAPEVETQPEEERRLQVGKKRR